MVQKIMKRVLAILLVLFLPAVALYAQKQRDSLKYTLTDEFLDTVKVYGKQKINNYSLLGVNYGVTFSNTYFNPSKHNRAYVINANYIQLQYTYFMKMFDQLPMFAIVVGAEMGNEGYAFKAYDDGRTNHMDGATWCSMKVFEIPAMAQIHVDFDPFKIMANVGVYGGWRQSIERSGPTMDQNYAHSFKPYEIQLDYGLQGGAGFGIMLDPIEIHFNAWVRWGWSSFFQPDYEDPVFHPMNTYYYRFAYPLDIMATVGVHFQIEKRRGRTKSQLKKEAKNIVYGKTENIERQNR